MLMTGVQRIFLGSEILAKRDSFGSVAVKDAGIFWVAKKRYFWVMYLFSAQINNNKRILLIVWDFMGYPKSRDFLR